SVVWLNTNSSLTYPAEFAAGERVVILDGEGYFEVAGNPDRPFVIEAGTSKTTVLGTAFNIDMTRNNAVVLSVVEGKVQFSDVMDADFAILIAGERATMDADTRRIRKSVLKGSNALSWKTGMLTFRRTLLSEVVDDLEKHYDIAIDYDPALSDVTVSFTLNRKSVEEAMEILENLAGVTVSGKEKSYNITR
ncbi:MAG: FecR domain-containing protein, partial [Cyclobacteriaceae bacterium]